jgi:putative MFS transporter
LPERKWQIVGAAVGTAVLGLLFATHTTPLGLVVIGILITLMNSLLGYSFHAYQASPRANSAKTSYTD